MKPLLSTVVALCLILPTLAHPENIEEVKELPQSKEPVLEAEESKPQARKERCSKCSSTVSLDLKSPKDLIAALQTLPGGEVHTQQSFEGCSSSKGCAGIKVQDGKVTDKFGNLNAFGGEGTFKAGSTFGSNLLNGKISGEPLWWMGPNSPFKNVNSASYKASSSYTSTSGGAIGGVGAGGVDLTKNIFLNPGASGFAGGQSNYDASSSSFQATKEGELDVVNNPFLNGNINLASSGVGGSQGFGAGQASSAFGAGSTAAFGGSGYVGSSPSPFATSTGSNINLIQSAQKPSVFDFDQSQQTISDDIFAGGSNVNIQSQTGGDLQQTCLGQGYACVLRSQCNNGVANVLPLAKKQYCNTRTEVCCRLDASLAGVPQTPLGAGFATADTETGTGILNSAAIDTQSTYNQGFGIQTASNGASSFDASQATLGTGFGSTVPVVTPIPIGSTGAFAPTSSPTGFTGSTLRPVSGQGILETDTFTSQSENTNVFRPGAVGTGLKPGIPYLPPVDNTNSGTNVVSSTVFPSTPFVTTPRPVSTPRPIIPRPVTTPRPYTPVRPVTTPRPVSRPTYLPPVSSTSAPGYLPPVGEQTINRETFVPSPDYNEGGIILDESRFPSTTRQPIVPVLNEIPAGCAAALKCTPIEFCTADGIISNTTIILSRDQDAYRVPLTDCKDLATGRIGKCCRDPFYTDPWPTNQLGKWVPGVFGGNDGKYVPDNSESSNTIRNQVTRRPDVTGSTILNNFRTTKPTPPTFGTTTGQGVQFTPNYNPVTQFGQGKFTKGGVGQYGQGGIGQVTQSGIGQYGQKGIGQIGQTGLGQFGQTGVGLIGQAGVGQTGQVGVGQIGEIGVGQYGKAGVGRVGQAGIGQRGQVGVGQVGIGQRGQVGIGQRGQGGIGQIGQVGVGQRGQVGVGQRGQVGLGQRGQVGIGQVGQTGIGQVDQTSIGQIGQTGIGQIGQVGVGQRGQAGVGQFGQGGIGQFGQGAIGQRGQVGQAGIGQVGVTGIGQVAQAGIGQRGQVGVAQVGQAGIGQRGQVGVGQVGQAGIGQRGQVGVGQVGQAGIGQVGVTGIGQVGQAGIGQRGQVGQAGIGQVGVAGIGQVGQAGIGQRGQVGVAGIGQVGQAGIGQRGQVGVGQIGQAGIGQRGQVGFGQGTQIGVGQRGQAGVGIIGQAGVGQTGQVGQSGLGQVGVGQRGQVGVGQVGQIGIGQRGQVGVGQRGQVGVGQIGIGQNGQAGIDQLGQGSIGQVGQAGIGQIGQSGVGQIGQTGVGQIGEVGVGQVGQYGVGQRGQVGVGQRGQVGVGQIGQAGIGLAGQAGVGQTNIGQYGQAGIGQGVQAGVGQYGQGEAGQYVQNGVGQYTQNGVGQYTQSGIGQYSQRQVIGQGQGQIGVIGQGTGIEQGEGAIISQGKGQLNKVSQGIKLEKGQGQYTEQGVGQAVIQGGGVGIEQGGGVGIQQGGGVSIQQGGGVAIKQGGGVGIQQGGGVGIQQGGGVGIQQGGGVGIQQGGGVGIQQGGGVGIQQGGGVGIQQGGGVGIQQGVGLATENEYSASSHRIYLQRYDGAGQCGVKHGQRPYGNHNDLEVDFAEIPWQAMVLLQTNKSLLCGGVISRPDVVLTSASCVDGLDAKNVLVKGGEWKLGIDEEPLPFQIVQVKTIIFHPGYKSGSLQDDVAILYLSENLRLANNIQPICMPDSKDSIDAFYNGGGECIVTGWGKIVLQAHLAGSIMHSVNVSLIQPDECESKLQQDYPHLLDNYDRDSCACGQPTNPLNNICKVDIGSALACTTGDGYYVMQGIYSWDSGCQVGNQLAAFYKFDIEWYEWAIGLTESVRYSQYGIGTKITQTKYTGQVISGTKGIQYTKGIKGTITKGVKGYGIIGQGQNTQIGVAQGATGQTEIGAGQTQFGTGQTQFGTGQSQFGITKTQFGIGQTQLGGGKTEFGIGQTQLGGGKTQFGIGQTQFGIGQIGAEHKEVSAEEFAKLFGQGQLTTNFSQFGAGQGSLSHFGKFDEGSTDFTSGSLNLGTDIKGPISNTFSATYSEKKFFKTEPKIYTYTTKPEIVTYTTKPEIVTFTTKPEIFTYTTKPKIVTYTTKPKIITYTTKPKIVTYTTKPQIITYETSGSGTNPQYIAPGVTFNPSFSEVISAQHKHNAQCKCLENGKK